MESKEDNAPMSDGEDIEKDPAAAAASKITEGFTQLSEGLQTLQKQAELAEQEEQNAKRPRINPPEHPSPEGLGSQQPFGGPA